MKCLISVTDYNDALNVTLNHSEFTKKDNLFNLLTDHLLVNSLIPLLVGHWSINDEAKQCYNLEGKSASNVIPGKDLQELVAILIDRFSFPGQWVLDSSKSNGK